MSERWMMDKTEDAEQFLQGIVERENRFLAAAAAIVKSGGSLWIWGNGMVAERAAWWLNYAKIPFDGFLVNEAYYSPDAGSDVFCFEEVCRSASSASVNLVVAFSGYRPEMLNAFRDKIGQVIEMDVGAGMTHYAGETVFSYPWLESVAEELSETYRLLADQLSRDTMAAYCNQKISLDYRYLEAVRRPPENQYFDPELIRFADHEILVNCGAYTGDSAEAFVKAIQKSGGDYSEIISFEPSPCHFEKCVGRNLPRHRCLRMGCSDAPGRILFHDDGTSSAAFLPASAADENALEVDTIDNVLAGGRATFIKMDIEGAELSALKGAEKTIRAWKPLLAICAYHKPEDLIKIPRFIRSLVPEYRWYLRAYHRAAIEVVLYAIPPDRLPGAERRERRAGIA